ncbi:unnamed protein product [Allacma fusca]|uniref:Tubulin/FtsZ 2-layer sandwich domain-containing protein n=1 Tax=Allacma fusca TaxID=39272 RepID=A0A8J2P9W6_9HEXA|nr:unnamed protein product [Allacma fusca]
MAACVLYRGDVTPNDVNEVLIQFKNSKSRANRLQFVDWSPGGFKVGMCNQRPMAVPGSELACGCRSVVGILNTTAMGVVWQRILKKFDLLFYRRAFVHWYIAEGMEEGEFSESRENLETLMMDFHEIGLDTHAEHHEQYKGHQDVDLHGHRPH